MDCYGNEQNEKGKWKILHMVVLSINSVDRSTLRRGAGQKTTIPKAWNANAKTLARIGAKATTVTKT